MMYEFPFVLPVAARALNTVDLVHVYMLWESSRQRHRDGGDHFGCPSPSASLTRSANSAG